MAIVSHVNVPKRTMLSLFVALIVMGIWCGVVFLACIVIGLGSAASRLLRRRNTARDN